MVVRGVVEATDSATLDVDVIEIAVRTDRELNRRAGALSEDLRCARVGQTVGAGRQEPGALPRVIGEEQRALIRRRKRRAIVKRQAGDAGAAVAAAVTRHDIGAVGVRVVGRRHAAGRRVQVLTGRQAGPFKAALAPATLVTGPAEVDRRGHRRADVLDAIDLFPAVPTDVGDPQLLGCAAERHPERIAQAARHDRRRRRNRPRIEQRRHRFGIDPQHLAVEPGRERRCRDGRIDYLRAQRAALRGRRRERCGRIGRITERVAGVAVVDGCERRAVAAADIEETVRAPLQVADAVARELIAPVLDQRRLRHHHARHRIDHDPIEMAGDRARHRRVGAVVVVARHRTGSQRVADFAVHREQRVDVRFRREAGVDRDIKQAAIPVVHHFGLQVRDHDRRATEGLEQLDRPAFLRDENPTVGRKAHGRRQLEAVDHRLRGKARRQNRRLVLAGGRLRLRGLTAAAQRQPGSQHAEGSRPMNEPKSRGKPHNADIMPAVW